MGFVPLWEIIQDPQGEVFKVPPELATRQPFNAIVMLVGVYQDFKKGPNGFEPLPGVAVRAGAGFCLGRNTVLTCAHFGTCSVSPKLGTVGLLLDGVAFAAWRLNCSDESEAIPAQCAVNFDELSKLRRRGVIKIKSFQSFKESAVDRLHWSRDDLLRLGYMIPTLGVVDLAIVKLASPIKGDVGMLPVLEDPFEASMSLEHRCSGRDGAEGPDIAPFAIALGVPLLPVDDSPEKASLSLAYQILWGNIPKKKAKENRKAEKKGRQEKMSGVKKKKKGSTRETVKNKKKKEVDGDDGSVKGRGYQYPVAPTPAASNI